MKNLVFVFSGPSGAGKTTLIKYVLDIFSDKIGTTVSCTTRKQRAGETEGVDYHFMSKEDFEISIKNGEFLEYVECYGNMYGTLKNSVKQVLLQKEACIIDVEFKGAYNILTNGILDFNCIGILILPPSIEALKERLMLRKSETEESLNKRLVESFTPENIADYKHVIINKNLESAKKELINILNLYEIA